MRGQRKPNEARAVREEMDRLRKEIKALKTRKTQHFAAMAGKHPEVGLIGTLPSPLVRIEQVIGTQDVRISTHWREGYSFPGRTGEIIRAKPYRVHFWITGLPTQGFVDGRGVELANVFEITDTKTYTTIGGATNTVLVLEVLDLSQYRYSKKPK